MKTRKSRRALVSFFIVTQTFASFTSANERLLASANESTAAECATIEKSRELFRVGSHDAAMANLECRLMNNPEDQDARLMLANMSWWTGKYQLARTRLLELPLESLDPASRKSVARKLLLNRLALGTSFILSEASNSSNYSASFSHRTARNSDFSFGYAKVSRSYEPNVLIEDESYRLGLARKISSDFSADLNFAHSPTSSFLPEWSGEGALFYTSPNEALTSAGLRVSRYENSTGTLVHLGRRNSLNASFDFFNQLFYVMSPKAAFSGVLGIEYLAEIYRISFSMSGGESLEDETFTDEFVSLDVGAVYDVNHLVSLRLNGTRRFGVKRSETEVGIGLEWIF